MTILGVKKFKKMWIFFDMGKSPFWDKDTHFKFLMKFRGRLKMGNFWHPFGPLWVDLLI